MTDKSKLKFSSKSPYLRYSQKSSNSSENSDLDYNLYCYSQGYKNLEKGYWRGVLRNKNVDFDLRFNKEWNRRIELENDDYEQTNYFTKKAELQLAGLDKFSKEYITLINESEIGWNSDRFKNFQMFQNQNGIKKQKNKEWILSNKIKRKSEGVDSNLQNYTQIDSNKSKYSEDISKKGFTDGKGVNSNLSKSLQIADINNKNYSGSNTYKKPYNIKGIDINSGSKSYLDYGKKNLQTEYNYDKNKIGKSDKNISSIKAGKDKSYDTTRVREIQGNKGNKISIDQSYDWYRNISPISKLNPKNSKITNGFGTNYADNKQPQKKKRQEFKYGQSINRTASYDNTKGKSLSYIGKLNEPKNKTERTGKEAIDKYGRSSSNRRFDDKYEQQKRTYSYDNQGKGKNEPRKGYENITTNYLNTEKKMPRDNKFYDKQKPKLDILTYEKSTYDRKQQQPLKTDTTPYDKKKSLQDQKTKYDRTSYDPKKIGIQSKGKIPQTKAPTYDKTPQGKKKWQNQPSIQTTYDKSSSKPQIKNTPYDLSSYKNEKPQISIKNQLYGIDNKTPYNKNKLQNSLQTSTSTYNKNNLPQSQKQTLQTQSRTNQSKFDKSQTTYEQKKPISKYGINKNASLTNTDLKTRGKESEYKPSYVKRFDFDDKEIKLKNYKKPASSYDKKKPKIKGELLIFEKRLERPANLVRLEVSVERKRTDSEKGTRTPDVREHQRIYSSRKKKKQIYDSEGKPLTNIRRLNDSTEKKSKKPEGERLPNYSRLETSGEKKKKDYQPIREISPRKNERIDSSKKERKQNYDSQDRSINNMGRLNASPEKNNKYVKKLDFDENIIKDRYNIPQKTKTETGKLKTKPVSNIYLQKGLIADKQKPSYDKYNQIQKDKDKDKSKQNIVYQKPKEQRSYIQNNKQKTDYNKPSNNYNNYPSSTIAQKKQTKLIKTQTQTQLKPKKYQFNQDYEQKSKTNISGYQKPQKYGKGIAPDYQQYSLVSQTQPQKGLNRNADTSSTYGVGSSNLNTASTRNKMSKTDRINKSFDGPRFADKPYINISDKYYDSKLPEKNKYLQNQPKQQPKKAEINIIPFAQSSNLSTSKDALSKLSKYYRPINDNKNKNVTPGQESSSLSKMPKSSDKYLPKKTLKDNNAAKKVLPEKERPKETRYDQYLQPLTDRKKNDQYNKKVQPSKKLLDKAKSEYPSLIKGKTTYDIKPKASYEQKNQKNYDSITGISKYKAKTDLQQKEKNQPYGTAIKENDKYSNYQTRLQKNNLGQPLKPIKTIESVYQLKTEQKGKYTVPKFPRGESYEYNPYSKNNLYEYKPTTTLVNKKNTEKKGILSQSTDDYRYPKGGYKKGTDSFANKTFNNSYMQPGSNKYSSTIDKNKKYDSSSYLKDKNVSYADNNEARRAKGDKYRNYVNSEDKMRDGQRNRSNQNNLYNLYGTLTPSQRNSSMSYFKLQFLTTKEVCEKFWKSIDNEELPISMFDSNKSYGIGSSDRNNSFKF